jgi:hypothetical protein
LCPWPARLAGAAALGVLLAPAPAVADAVLDVSGSVVSVSPRLEVQVVVTNRGDAGAAPLDVVGELLGQRRESHLPGGVAPGGTATIRLDFSPEEARPGVHALTLLLEHPLPGLPDAAGNPPYASQCAWLLIALGKNADPAVRLVPEPLRLSVRGELRVRLSSADGAAHRVHVRAFTPRGLRAMGEGLDVDVPPSGALDVSLPVLRAGAARGTRHGVLVVAETRKEALCRTTVATGQVEVSPDPSLLPRLRRPIAAAGLLLLLAALGAEVWRHARPPA